MKLYIDIFKGIIDIEGTPEFIREIYSDFKEQLLNGVKPVIFIDAAIK